MPVITFDRWCQKLAGTLPLARERKAAENVRRAIERFGAKQNSYGRNFAAIPFRQNSPLHLPVVYDGAKGAGDDFISERDILYKILFQLRSGNGSVDKRRWKV